ncbi:hypothetical protein [Marinifilum breve]|nr:hypothetical protein [Marinifilum breve]
MIKNLTDTDIKEIKYMTRAGYIIPTLFLAFAALESIYLVLGEGVDPSTITFILINASVVTCLIIISYLINRKYFKDLKSGEKKIEIHTVQKKEDRTSYEAGSGTLHIPILGDLFPKLWSQEMKKNYLMYLIIKNTRFEVSKELYDQVNIGESVQMHYSRYSNILLSIKKNN